MKNILYYIKKIYYKIKNKKAIVGCEYYKDCSCNLIYTKYCNFPNCNIRFDYIGKEFVYCPNCKYFDDCCSGKFGLGCYKGGVIKEGDFVD